MRPEQKEAVERTAAYFRDHAGDDRSPKFLWNAKMRFGKTFAAYQLAREMGWKRVLVLTYKPAVQAAWRDDLLGHVDFAGWHFVDRETPIDEADALLSGPDPVVRFASFQDLGQKSEDGDVKEHNESLLLTDWDCIVLDEYHFGAWRDSARELYDPADKALAEKAEPDEEVTEEDLGLESAHYLYLSGTPFRAITNGEFTEDATFDWTYVDEQEAKEGWEDSEGQNPYVELPKMEMYAYEIAPGAAGWAEEGEFSGFSLTEYFKATRVDAGRRTPESGRLRVRGPRARLRVPRDAPRQALRADEGPDRLRPEAPLPLREPGVYRADQALGLVHARRRLLLCDARHARCAPLLLGLRGRRRCGLEGRAGRRGEAAGGGGDRQCREGPHLRLDHALLRQADDRRDRARVGSDPDAALAEVA